MPPAAVLHRPVTPPGLAPHTAFRHLSRLSFGVVCSSNINRSMEAHVVLQNAGLRVASYGTGSTVRLPGKTAMEPRIFKFGMPYKDIHGQLSAIDHDFFSRNKVLGLCQRGAAVKTSATRWQDADDIRKHDVVICFEERIYDAVMEDLLSSPSHSREPSPEFRPMHIICLDTKDNPLEAQIQGRVCLDLCWRLEHSSAVVAANVVDTDNNDDDNDDLQQQTNAVAEIIEEFQQQRESYTPIKILYQVCYL